MDYKIFGCKVNKYYTDKWLKSEKLKWKKGIFIASCVVTDNAKRKWIKFVKDTAKKLKDDEKIYISWCGTFIDGKKQDNFYELYPELIYLESKIETLDEDPETTPLNSPLTGGSELLNKIEKIPQLYTKKFVLIQWGCDSYCTYCLTVKKRGEHFSRPKEEILKEILEFEKTGWKEIVITWINLWAWWASNTNNLNESKFDELLVYILENCNINRIRISSLWPEFITDKLLKLFENSRIYPHFHFSIQSGSTNVLKSMSRHYNWEDLKELLEKTRNLKRDDWVKIGIWADLIIWFPWETSEDFKDTLDLIEKYKITKLHAFPFSGHKIWENVAAWSFPNQIDDKTKKERMWEIMNRADHVRDEFIDENIWKELNVLIEVVKKNENTGKVSWKWWTQNYIEADNSNFDIISGEVKRNSIVKWKLIN